MAESDRKREIAALAQELGRANQAQAERARALTATIQSIPHPEIRETAERELRDLLAAHQEFAAASVGIQSALMKMVDEAGDRG